MKIVAKTIETPLGKYRAPLNPNFNKQLSMCNNNEDLFRLVNNDGFIDPDAFNEVKARNLMDKYKHWKTWMIPLERIGFYTLEDERAKHASIKSPLWRCELLLTNKCNFKCPYCRGTKNDANISFNYAKHVVDLWSSENLQNVRFSGGEPTRVPWLLDLIKYTNDSNIKRIALSTNGSADSELYLELYKAGVYDFSISLDACCSDFGDKMAGIKGVFDNVVDNIRMLSSLTYVTVGCVFDENNIEQSLETIMFAHELGVSDIRIISSAQYNEALKFAERIPSYILDAHPILKYRVNNFLKGRNVRGIQESDNHKCPLVLDDMAIRGEYHYPCIIKMREGCAPVGKVSKNMRKERYDYYLKHDCFNDPICRNNCLDVCIDYNNKYELYHS